MPAPPGGGPLHHADRTRTIRSSCRRRSPTGHDDASPCTTAPGGSPASAPRWRPTSAIARTGCECSPLWSVARSVRRASCGCTSRCAPSRPARCGRPVKLVLTRDQMFSSTGHRPRTEQHLSLVADDDARVLSTEQHTLTETSTVAHFCEPVGLSARFLYESPRLWCRTRWPGSTRPHRVSCGGPGRHQGCSRSRSRSTNSPTRRTSIRWSYGCAIDADVDQASGKPWSGKHLRECYLQGAERFGWDERPMAPRSLSRGGVQVGWGMATATYPGPTDARGLPGADRCRRNGRIRLCDT